MGTEGKQSGFTKEFLETADKLGSKKALMSDVVGMPDAKDEENIMKLIAMYDAVRPGMLNAVRNEARRQFEVGKYGTTRNDEAVVNKDSSMTYDFELPSDFVHLIEKYYPTMFRDRRHFRWFKRKLPGLMVRPNVKKASKR